MRNATLLRLLRLSPAALLAGCASAPPGPSVLSAFVVLGEQGSATARVLSSADTCPPIDVDGRQQPMQVRAAAATIAQRRTASAPADSKPSAFPVLTCELVLPAGSRTASVTGQALPLPRPEARRIVVIGDTGCRLKKADNAFQACNDPEQAPFGTVAAAAAAWGPDLVVHVGDYHYRENPCPDGNAGCAGSPWGYGWDTWRADFFQPAAPLLRAAPWIVVRGNHESCVRGGQGWWRFLDPRPLVPARDCNVAADDAVGDYSDPYAVPLAPDTQLLVVDTAATTWRGLKPGNTGYERYRDAYPKVAALAARTPYNLLANHHPILGFGADLDKNGQRYLQLGDKGLQDSFGAVDPLLLPANVQALLSGHVHLWEQVSFSSPHPSQFVAGFSGTAEATVPLPDDPMAVQPAPGAVIDAFSSWVGGFGFMTMERDGPGRWRVAVHDRHGAIKNRCTLTGRQSRCETAQIR
ncbi:metallophosphoesterase family protein [Pseudoduganella chitinolytica]|uniref:Metallophosphoesterase n=1 Tax=Pseudoduganella chitinolytica TaxID=34070 RepID=A0ABY8B7E1_9BURK|nr:metallophosphoesterase [Pseudoduganella chitinolytica]WEF31631.1 metallophosphoesterase [Pseudoduganella chitinolytica]